MEVIIKGDAKEIAALVLAVQERQDSEIIDKMSGAVIREVNLQTEPNRLFQ